MEGALGRGGAGAKGRAGAGAVAGTDAPGQGGCLGLKGPPNRKARTEARPYRAPKHAVNSETSRRPAANQRRREPPPPAGRAGT